MSQGLLVFVYTHRHQPSITQYVLTGENIPEVFEPNSANPELVLKYKQIGANRFVYAVPKALEDKQTMFGGNFVFTTDSRFPSQQPIPVHDRV